MATAGCSYGSINRAEFSKSTAKLFAKAFEEIEDKLKLLLTATTKTKVKLVSRVDTVAEWLSDRVVEHVAEQFGDSTYSITISEDQENVIAEIANAWFWDTIGNALEDNDLRRGHVDWRTRRHRRPSRRLQRVWPDLSAEAGHQYLTGAPMRELPFFYPPIASNLDRLGAGRRFK